MKKDRQADTWMHKKVGIRWVRISDGKAVGHRETQLVYYIGFNEEAGLLQLNKEAEFMIHTWIKGTGLANLSRSSLCRGSGERKLGWTFSRHS